MGQRINRATGVSRGSRFTHRGSGGRIQSRSDYARFARNMGRRVSLGGSGG
jgi:hypothetical protein